MKTETLSVRVDSQLVTRIKKFEAVTKVEKATLVRSAVAAALDYFEKHGSIRFPLVIHPFDDVKK